MESLFPVQIVLAEFDIDTGSCVRARYPDVNLPCHTPAQGNPSSPTKLHGDGGSTWEHYLADQMLPDGAEKHDNSKTMFVLNRPHVQTSKERERFRVFAFRGTEAPPAHQHRIATSGDNSDHEQDVVVPPLATSTPETVWSRVNHPSLPDGFVPEELSVDVVSGAIRIVDKYGAIHFADIAAQQHSVEMLPSTLPDAIQMFTNQLQVHRSGGTWEDVIFDPTAEGIATPSLVPHHHHHHQDVSGSINSTVAALNPGVTSAHEPVAAHPPQAPLFVLARINALVPATGVSAGEPLAVLMTMRDFNTLSTILRDFPVSSSSQPDARSSNTTPVKVSTMLPSCDVSEEDALAFMRSGVSPSADLNNSATLSEGSAEESRGRVVLFGLCAAITRKDAEVRRGGINKSVALIGPSIHLLEPFYELLVDAAEKCCEVKGKGALEMDQQRDILCKTFDAIRTALRETDRQAGISKLTQLDRCAFATAAGDCIGPNVATSTQVTCFNRRRKVIIPHLEAAFGAGSFQYRPRTSTTPLLALVQGLKDKIFVLLAALLGRCRVVVYSRSFPSTNVCECVVALGALMESVDPRFVRQRVYPYTSINHMSLFDSVPGFVVGTLNPMFESQKSWWDVLVDISSDGATLAVANSDMEAFLFINNDRCSHRGADKEAFRELHRGIVHRRSGLHASEQELECYVADFLQEYLRSCVTFALFGSPRSSLFKTLPRKLMDVYPAAQRSRMERWMGTDLHDTLQQFSRSSDATASFLVSCLRRSQLFEDFEIVQLVQELLRSSHDRDLVVVLSQFAASLGGLAPLAAKMVHGSLAVRMTVVTLMRKLEVCTAVPTDGAANAKSAGRICVTKLNGLLMNIYETLHRDLPDTSMAY